MDCRDTRGRLGAYLDGELPAAERSTLEDHVAGCAVCAAALRRDEQVATALRDGLPFFAAPETLRRTVMNDLRRAAELDREAARWRQRRMAYPLALAASLLLGVALGTGGTFLAVDTESGGVEVAAGDAVVRDVVSAHVRGLMPGHLTDVASTDRHTVKPWFAGRIDFSPPVVDLEKDGFPLIGGRLDYIEQRTAAVLAYRRNGHIIQLFVVPTTGADVAQKLVTRQGYNICHWARGGMSFWAVSDASADELERFERLLRTAAGAQQSLPEGPPPARPDQL
jgi:anti-sigma factor RsiW